MNPRIRHLILFAKSPVPGEVKTRIGIKVGMEEAATIYQHMLEIALTESTSNEMWQQKIAITPESDEKYFQSRELNCWRQWGDGIGNRMSNMLEQSFLAGADQVILIGSDCPTLGQAELAEIFLLLEKVPAVIGPSEDGGFYLIGVGRECYQTVAHVFRQAISWSTPKVLEQVQHYCRGNNLPLHIVGAKRDIDTYEDWLLYLAAQQK